MSLQKQFFLFFFLLLSFNLSVASPHQLHRIAFDSIHSSTYPTFQIGITDSIINYAKIFMNSRYHRGGNGSSKSFDCSGFTSFVYRNFGFELKHSSAEQATQFDSVNLSDLKTGDLVFFSGRHISKRVGHVGIVVVPENGSFNFIHASSRNGVIISKSDEPYYMKRYIKAGRVIPLNSTQPTNNINVKVSETILADTFHSKQLSNTNLTFPHQTNKYIPAIYHKVKKGETLSSIASKYGLTVTELKHRNNIKTNRLNAKQRLKIKDKEVVCLVSSIASTNKQIPISKAIETVAEQPSADFKTEVTQATKTHIVSKGETLFSISKMYSIPVNDLKRMNDLKTTKIKLGQLIKIQIENSNVKSNSEIVGAKPSQESDKPFTDNTHKPLTHKVAKGESLLKIAQQYSTTVNELKTINRLTSTKIKYGQVLILKIDKTNIKNLSDSVSKNIKISYHKVKKGESYYSIAHQYGCKVEELKKWNNKQGNVTKIGEKLIIRQ